MLARRNYKVYADLGISTRVTTRHLSVLDTGAGSSFIRRSDLPPNADKRIVKLDAKMRVRDANNRLLPIVGKVALFVRLGSRLERITFYVSDRLAAPVILGCDFCDTHVEAIRPRRRVVELDDGTTVPIVRRPQKRSAKAPPLPEEQQYVPPPGRASTKITAVTPTLLPPESQTWVSVKTDRHGLILVEPAEKLYDNHSCAPTNGVAQVEAGKPFRILVANFSQHPFRLKTGQVVGHALPHPTSIYTSNVTLAEVLGLTEEDEAKELTIQSVEYPTTQTTVKVDKDVSEQLLVAEDSNKRSYSKRGHNAKDHDLINKHIVANRTANLQKDEAAVTADTVPLGVPERHHDKIRSMLKKHERM